MYIDIEEMKHELLVAAISDGEAYRDNKNAKVALQRVRHQAVKEFYATLLAMNDELLAKITEDWKDESEAEDARREEHRKFWDAMATGAQVTTTRERYEEMLNILPPEFFDGTIFAVGEPYSHSVDGEPIHAFFWQAPGGSYQAQYLTLKTRQGLNEVKRPTY